MAEECNEKKQGKNWSFTLNNYTEEDIQWFKNLEKNYIIMAKETAPTTGTPHLQGFISFVGNHRFGSLKKMHPKVSWRFAKGGAQTNHNYVKKVDNEWVYEDGALPRSRSGAEGQGVWREALVAAREGREDDIPSDILFRYYGTVKRIRMDAAVNTDTLAGNLPNLWFYGPPGTGKSRKAREEHPNAFIKPLNKWWDNYAGEDDVIIEEFHPDSKLTHYMKIWCDRYAFMAEVKGGSRKIRPGKIIVTSNYSIAECFHGVDLVAIQRRFTEVKFN